jgi:CBS domain-containing membrane protein
MAAPSHPDESLGARLASWLQAFRPATLDADWRERARVVGGAFFGILVTAWLCRAAAVGQGSSVAWLIAPMGASAVLVFGVPASPLAQPWAVVAGNTVSALAGIACVHLGWSTVPTAALAVGLAIGAMFALRCLHPPGGASALLIVLTGVGDLHFALQPVLLNSLLLAAAGVLYNSLTGRRYPHAAVAPPPAAATPDAQAEARAEDADLDAVLARYNQVLDISRDDLKALLHDTQLQSYRRRLARLTCGDIMSRRLITVTAGTPIDDAWPLFKAHRIKALPVVDARDGIVGIVTPADFLRSPRDGTPKPMVVGDIMTRQVRVASVYRHLVELIPLFGSTGHHHIPIVDGQERLVGIVTQSDVVAALVRADPTLSLENQGAAAAAP